MVHAPNPKLGSALGSALSRGGAVPRPPSGSLRTTMTSTNVLPRSNVLCEFCYPIPHCRFLTSCLYGSNTVYWLLMSDDHAEQLFPVLVKDGLCYWSEHAMSWEVLISAALW